MTSRLSTLTVSVLMLFSSWQVHGQGLRMPGGVAPAPEAATPADDRQAKADFIVAVVHSAPITLHDVRLEAQRLVRFLTEQNQEVPNARIVANEALENLIVQKAQLFVAGDTGIKVDDFEINEAEQSVAAQNQVSVAELHKRLAEQGQRPSDFRERLREQILVQRLRDREVESRVRVTDRDIDQFLQEQQLAMETGDYELNLAQIVISVPDTATTPQIEALKARAQRAQERAKKGEDFTALVKEFSDSGDAATGGLIGLRAATRYPESFVQATQALQVGDVSALVRTAAGFHVLKVVEKLRPGMPPTVVTQTMARHILLIPNASLPEAEARAKLLDFKKQVLAKQADFAALAKEHSKDGSAVNGGDLGWANPGMFVPEFEEVLNRLTPGEVSDPLVSRFGVHLIQLMERRQATLTPEQQRDAVRAKVRDKKLQETYATWIQELRRRAYVEIREAPL